jgi:hypothetical protein
MHVHTDKCQHGPAMGRRNFVKLLSLGAGASIVSVASPLRANGKAKALMLSCMDYRLTDELVSFMDRDGMHDEYDHVVLAGASLGVVAEELAAWRPAFWDQLDLAVKLHGIEEVIVVDHRDCGAYKLIKGAEAVDTPEKELAVHTEVLAAFAAQVHEKHPDLGIVACIMALDGTVESVDVKSMG